MAISIKWLKDGEDYLTMPGKSSTTEIREMERVTSKLRINQAIPPEDAGTYSCQASNAFGSSHFRIDVTIWGKSNRNGFDREIIFPYFSYN